MQGERVRITLMIHLERADVSDGPGFVWWAESPDLAGFSAAADHLPDLLRQAEKAIDGLVANADIVPTLAPIQGTGEGLPVRANQPMSGTRGVEGLLTVVAA